MEGEFEARLREALKRSKQGAVGLFGHHDHFSEPERRWLPESTEGMALVELGREINELRADLGLGDFALFAKFLEYRSRKGSNVPGDQKLAALFFQTLLAVGDK